MNSGSAGYETARNASAANAARRNRVSLAAGEMQDQARWFADHVGKGDWKRAIEVLIDLRAKATIAKQDICDLMEP